MHVSIHINLRFESPNLFKKTTSNYLSSFKDLSIDKNRQGKNLYNFVSSETPRKILSLKNPILCSVTLRKMAVTMRS
jgi:hypothetical protein